MLRSGRHDGTDVRRILAAMITDSTVCGRITTQWPDFGLFSSDWSNIVGGWCVEYYKKYGEAPNGHLQSLFEEWAGENPNNDDKIQAVEKFLQYTSDEKRFDKDKSSDYYIDLAEKHFNKIRLEKDVERLTEDLEHGQIEKAQDRIENSRPVLLGIEKPIEPANDFQLWENAFTMERRRPLITYPGSLGAFISDSFIRGELYAFAGPDKTGKTTYLIDLVYRAVRRRNRVAFFDVGDGDQNEVVTRLGSRAADRSIYGGDLELPTRWDDDHLVCKIAKPKMLDTVDAFRAFSKIAKSPDALRVSCHSNSSIDVAGISNILDKWTKDGWKPAVVVIDYADILAPPKGVKDNLDKIDDTWKQLRRLSQERNCLVVTATQSNAAAYGRGKSLLGKQHFSGRKTKNAHVNGMIGINVTDEERENQEARLNWIVKRRINNRKKQTKYVTVAGCFDIHNPAIISK